MNARAPAIVILGAGSLPVARKIAAALPGAQIHGLKSRVTDADIAFEEFGVHLRDLFARDTPIIVLCATGIVVRALAPLLQDKRAEPPVVVVAEDGSAIVPLLGGLRGVNDLAKRIGAALETAPAITTTGEVRFGTTLELAPEGYVLANPAAGKRFMSDLLAGAKVRIDGVAPWLAETRLPIDPAGTLTIRVTPTAVTPAEGELVFHPCSVRVDVRSGATDRVMAALEAQGLSVKAVACIVASKKDAADPAIHALAQTLDRPLRIVAAIDANPVALSVADAPIDPATIGRARGKLCVIGIGPGSLDWRTPEAARELAAADDLIGYETYLRMAGPFAPHQMVHATDNREEMARARHAFELAAQGRSVAVVSSGDPGIFAMATAVLEALHESADPAWHGVELKIVPGISAAQAAAARSGAPLGHDFCVISLSDNLKPWDVIERRLTLAAQADLVLALYNPISRARPTQLAQALTAIRAHRGAQTPVVLGRDIGRPDESLRVVTLGTLDPADVDMRTVVIVGSSTTTAFDGARWVYTPRWYGDK
ncbi:MAG: precorrin-3B C(17)-methyltransferase [Alphaproteobacteria bacterium]|nr:precorrin-3B C(17)-methyltransferase [Alphaproteobacteria bacterium]